MSEVAILSVRIEKRFKDSFFNQIDDLVIEMTSSNIFEERAETLMQYREYLIYSNSLSSKDIILHNAGGENRWQ